MQTNDLYDNAKKNFDDNISIPKILGFFKNICTKWDFSNKLAFFNPKWAWISCDFKSNRTNTCIG